MRKYLAICFVLFFSISCQSKPEENRPRIASFHSIQDGEIIKKSEGDLPSTITLANVEYRNLGAALSIPVRIAVVCVSSKEANYSYHFETEEQSVIYSEYFKSKAALFREELYLNLAKEIAITEEEIKVRFEALEQMRQISLLKSQQAVKIVELAYKGGGSTLLEFLDTTRSYNETRLKYIDALVEYERALLSLKYIAGFDYEPD